MPASARSSPRHIFNCEWVFNLYRPIICFVEINDRFPTGKV